MGPVGIAVGVITVGGVFWKASQRLKKVVCPFVSETLQKVIQKMFYMGCRVLDLQIVVPGETGIPKISIEWDELYTK